MGKTALTSLRLLPALARRAAGILAPPVCTLCGGDGQVVDEIWGLDLCSHCEAACPVLSGACLRCAEPCVPTEVTGRPVASLCLACQRDPPPFDAAFCAFRYADPVDLMVTRLKFQHELVYARVLGMLFARSFRSAGRSLPEVL